MAHFFDIVKESPDLGCSIKNCETFTWDINMNYIVHDEDLDNYTSILEIVLPKGSKVMVKRESLAYNSQNFMSDFGGYLGLLLGWSILSIYDTMFELWSSFGRKKK